MSHILLLPVGSAGDVFPFIWLGRQLLARGHRVTMITACLFEKAARQAGLEFVGLGTEKEFEDIQRDARIWKPYRATQFVFDFSGKSAMRTYREIEKISKDEPPSLMLGSLLAFGGRLAREKLGIPLLSVHLQPSVLISMYETPIFLSEAPWISRLPRWMKRLVFSFPNPADLNAKPWIKLACEELGIPSPRSLFKEWWHSPDGTLLLFPDWFAAPQPDWPVKHFQHTFPLEDLSAEQGLSDPLVSFLSEGDKPIVFTPGSANVQAQRFFEVALQAVLRLKQRAVFVTRDLSQLPSSLPPEVMAVEYAPFSTLLKQAACFVHHGGIGTLSQGFAAGVPQLLMPMAHDQPDNENRLRRLGAGMGLTPRKFTSERVAAALEELLLSPSVSASVAKCAELTRNRPGPEAMIEWIETKALR